VLVQSKRNKHAALRLMRKLLKKYAFALKRLVTDDLRSYAPAAQDLGIEHLRERGRWLDPHPIVSRSRWSEDVTSLESLLLRAVWRRANLSKGSE
jgi:transposase-like protein